jgi:HK97 family phage major capsid protein
MNITVFQERAKDFMARAEVANSEQAIAELRTEHGTLAREVDTWARERLAEAKAEGRERLHADDARDELKLRAVLGDVMGAIGAVETRHARTLQGRARISTPEAARTDTHEWKSIFPSMSEYKSLSIGNDPAGGYLVTAQAGPFFDRLRADSVVLQAGPMVLPCDSDALVVPNVLTSATAYKTGEGADITESSTQFTNGRIPMVKYAAFSVGTSEWFADAAYGPRQIIESDHRLQIAALLDSDMLQGSSTGILGLRRNGTDTALAAAGATPTLNNVLDALYRMEANNARPSAMFMHPRTWNTIRKLVDGQSRYQLAPDPSQSAVKQLFGVPVYLSSQISITEDSSNAANHDCSSIIVVDMRYVVVGRRQEVVVLYDPYSYSKSDKIALRSTTRWGMGVIFPSAVEVLSGVRP